MKEQRNDKERLEKLNQEYHQMRMTQEQVTEMKHRIKEAKTVKNKKHRSGIVKCSFAAAAALSVLILLPNISADVAYAMSSLPLVGKLVEVVTFRNYQYESDRQNADIQVPELVAGNQTESPAGDSVNQAIEQVNQEIQTITDQIISEFEKNRSDQEGYQDVVVKSEILTTTEQYFTLKLICYQGAGSGAEWDYFYTIDLTTGQRLQLKDLFTDGSDYITPISENIKTQMREQMAKDEMVHYWVDETDIPEWNFQAITDETSFYINADGNIVICFNEGDVAPMYMGCVEFVIPDSVVSGIMK